MMFWIPAANEHNLTSSKLSHHNWEDRTDNNIDINDDDNIKKPNYNDCNESGKKPADITNNGDGNPKFIDDYDDADDSDDFPKIIMITTYQNCKQIEILIYMM
jgi:hypothetical protein